MPLNIFFTRDLANTFVLAKKIVFIILLTSVVGAYKRQTG